MTRLVLIALLILLISGPAYSEWVSVDRSTSNGGYTVYTDPDTIRHKGNLVKMWYLFDYKTKQTVVQGSFYSTIAQAGSAPLLRTPSSGS